MGTLYIVATPIGNLEDLSRRAVSILQQVACIAAEDTRHTRKLLKHYQIQTPALVSFHDHSDSSVVESLLERLSEGDLALVSDAGTPGVNDPGFELVRAAIEHGHVISPIPGPSAPVAALAASGLPTDSFLYLGYLPRKQKERRALLEANRRQPHTLIFFETPHRLTAALEDLAEVFPTRQVVVAREMTKVYEEFVRGTPDEVLDHFSSNPLKGEITLIIAGDTGDQPAWSEEKLMQAIQDGLSSGEKASRLAKRLASESGENRRNIYRRIHKMSGEE